MPGRLTDTTVYPSAGCLSTSAPAIVCIAPGLFSTTMRQPSLWVISFATSRLMMSGGVPAAAATVTRMVVDG